MGEILRRNQLKAVSDENGAWVIDGLNVDEALSKQATLLDQLLFKNPDFPKSALSIEG